MLVGHFEGAHFFGEGYEYLAVELNDAARLALQVDGAVVSVLVDGTELFSHDFATGSLNDGLLGLGSANSDATFDDLTLSEGDPCPSGASLEAGPGPFNADEAVWTVGDGRMSSHASNVWNVADLQCGREMPASYTFETSLHGEISGGYVNGCVLFDYRGPDQFKYACHYAYYRLIGERDPAMPGLFGRIHAWETQAALPQPGAQVRLEVDGSDVSMIVDDVEVLRHAYSEPVGSGSVGVGQFYGDGSYGPAQLTTHAPLRLIDERWKYDRVRGHRRLHNEGTCSRIDDPVDPEYDPSDYGLVFSTNDEDGSWGWDSHWTPEGWIDHWTGSVERSDYHVQNYYDVVGWGARRSDWRSSDFEESMTCDADNCDYAESLVVDPMHDGDDRHPARDEQDSDEWSPQESVSPPTAFKCYNTSLGDDDERVVENEMAVDCSGGGTVQAKRTWAAEWEREFDLTGEATALVNHTESFVEHDEVARRTELTGGSGMKIHVEPITVEVEDDGEGKRTVELAVDLSVWARHSIEQCAPDFDPSLLATVYTQEDGEIHYLAFIRLDEPGFEPAGESSYVNTICNDSDCAHPYRRYTGAKTIGLDGDTVVVPSKNKIILDYLMEYRPIYVRMEDTQLVHPVSTRLVTEPKWPECDLTCRRELESETGNCCVYTWGSRWGHSSLECSVEGSEYYSYISKHPSGTIIHSDAKWKCLWQDYAGESLPGVVKEKKCSNCLDMAKVSEWFCDHKDDSFTFGSNWCVDAVLEAIAYALPEETPPTCPVPSNKDILEGCYYVVNDIVGDPLSGVTAPGDAQDVMTELQDNGCSRYNGCRRVCAEFPTPS